MFIICTSVFFRYYLYLFSKKQSQGSQDLVSLYPHCSSLLFNFIVSDITQLPPIKVTQRRRLLSNSASEEMELWQKSQVFMQESVCMNYLVKEFGYMPLRRSHMRLDPHLFADPVSITRKKYRQIDHLD